MLREDMSKHVRGQPEQQPADQGRAESTGQLPAKEVRRPRRKRQRDEHQHVVGNQRAGRQGERQRQQGENRDRGHPQRRETLRWPEQPRMQRVLTVCDRKRPPPQRPAHHLEIGGRIEAHDRVGGMSQNPDADENADR